MSTLTTVITALDGNEKKMTSFETVDMEMVGH